MEIVLTDEFAKRYRKLPSSIKKKAEKQERLFPEQSFPPLPAQRKTRTKGKQVWSFRIDRSYRVLFRFIEADRVVFLTVGPHDWIYKLPF